MSFLITNIQTVGKLCLNGLVKPVIPVRNISRLPILFQVKAESNEKVVDDAPGPANKDRSVKVPVETSIKYMESDAYKTTYGEEPVWKSYRRNYKGQFAPKKTRKTCIRGGAISTGNPCPICRDEYLVLDYRNIKLLNQFLSKFNGETLSYQVTNICQHKHQELLIAIKKAKDCGLLTYDPPHRSYNYSHWYKREPEEKE